jgi:hypothetical protein
MGRRVAQGINPAISCILELGIDRFGATFAAEAILSLPVHGNFLSRRLVGVFEATFIGHFTFLTSVARPLTVALNNG